jgi:hypothetical protein
MEMQSTGQGATHSSQPVHSDSITVCICFAAPTMASTGQAAMHSVQPMQRASSTKARCRGFSAPRDSSRGSASRPSSNASRRTPAAPPGGQRLGSAAPEAMASA